ncbi:hypothetical protein SDC9_107205 [bioreactor metagenome]|jgi:hypothetical protein|uniref:Protein BatD n=1 Tax=bioreactor metagenome TaxID=1076179 RepID=A0A645BF67_9ZZZZ
MIMQKDTLLIGDQTLLKYQKSIPKGANLIFGEVQSANNSLEIIGKPKIDTLSESGGVINLSADFTVTAFDSGSFVMPPVPAYLEKPDGTIDTLWFGGDTLEFKSIQIDTTTFKPFDVKGQINYPYTFKEFLPWGGGLLLLAAIVYLIIRLIRRKRAGKSLLSKDETPDPPHVAALKKIEQLKGQKLIESDRQKLFYSTLTDILREYMESRFSFGAMELTSAQILDVLKTKEIDKKVYSSVQELLSTSDLVKFAKYKADMIENERSIPIAIEFINATKVEEIEK